MNKVGRILTAVLLVATGSWVVGGVATAATTVPGHTDRYDLDHNGYPDAGQVVNGRYTDTYVDGDTVCTVTVIYRGDFGNDPYLDSGAITNNWLCKGPDGTVPYHYQIVHQSDPRYTGNPDWAVWGTWEYHVLTEGGVGNWVRPYTG